VRTAVLLACCTVLVIAPALRAEAPRVAIVLTAAPAHREAAEALRETLSHQGCSCIVIQLSAARTPGGEDEASPPNPTAATTTAPTAEGPSPQVLEAVRHLRESRPQVVVSVGGGATALALQAVPDVPVVFCMVPNVLDRSFVAKGAGSAARLLGVTTDISPQLQVEQIRHLSPKATNVGLIHGPRSRRTAEAIRAAGEKKGLDLTLIPAQLDKFAEALHRLDERGCDAALMIADADVYNSANVQALLLWGLRGRKPVWTFSPNLVKSGAFAGLYVDTKAMAAQTAGLVDKVLHETPPGERGLRYPEAVHGGVNERTAEMVGISLDRSLDDSVAVHYQRQ